MPEYRTIVADPPWPYADAGREGSTTLSRTIKRDGAIAKGVHTDYAPMALPTLEALAPPVEKDAHLYLWTTNAFMAEGHQIAEAWGFRQKTILTWVKTYQDDPARVSMKTGYYFRGATEHCLFCVRGSLPLQTDQALPTAYLWPRLPHSQKPDAFYDLVEQASPGPYLELFARRARFGWDYHGDESLGTAEVA